MSEFKQYRRKGLSEMRPYTKGESMTGISVSPQDNPETDMGMIARNPKNHADQWYVARQYLKITLNLFSGRISEEGKPGIVEGGGMNDKCDKHNVYYIIEEIQSHPGKTREYCPECRKEEISPLMKLLEAQCPVCGYYCTGNGGHGCIDKKSIMNWRLG